MMDLPGYVVLLPPTISAVWAEMLSYPLDVMKMRMQMKGKLSIPEYISVKEAIRHTKEVGLRGAYRGIQAAVARQTLVAGLRTGFYAQGKVVLGDDLQKGGWLRRGLNAAVASGLAVLLCTPLDVCRVRLATDMLSSRYTGLTNCLFQTSQEGLFHGLYKGASCGVYQSILINATELVTYDSLKSLLSSSIDMLENSPWVRIWAALCTGFLSACVSSPLDFIKTHYMSTLKPDPTRPKSTQIRYLSPLDCFKKQVISKGPGVLWTGFTFLCLRQCLWCLVYYVSLDYIQEECIRMHRKRTMLERLLKD